jgi:hypothetical protein
LNRSGRSNRSRPRPVAILFAVMMGLGVASLALRAHHGSAAYHVDREIAVTGTVTAWRWMSPHLRIVIAAAGRDDKQEEWDCEGPPLTWAAQRGWTASTLRSGERVTLVMYPARDGARSGLVRRIERSGGEVLEVSRPWLGER